MSEVLEINNKVFMTSLLTNCLKYFLLIFPTLDFGIESTKTIPARSSFM